MATSDCQGLRVAEVDSTVASTSKSASCLNAFASGLDDGTAGSAGVVGTDGMAGVEAATAPFVAAELRLGSFGISGLASEVSFGIEVASA